MSGKRVGADEPRSWLLRGDCLEMLHKFHANTFTAVVTDPPYGLKFMGRDWDHGVPGVSFWQAILRVCKPGAHLLAFGGTRTHHRLACAIEDAGWEMRDCLMWLYGTGFPKSHNIGNAVDKALGCSNRGHAITSGSKFHPTTGKPRSPGEKLPKYEGRTSEGVQWSGYGTALKPAFEPVLLCRKPLDGTVAANVLKHGCGALNIDGCRVGTTKNVPASPKSVVRSVHTVSLPGGTVLDGGFNPNLGRWPANVAWSHVPDQPCPACEGDYPACKLCGGTGVIRGCVLKGTKRVKGIPADRQTKRGKRRSELGEAMGPDNTRNTSCGGYADADGLKTVEDWDCRPDCPSRLFPTTGIDSGRRVAAPRLFALEAQPEVVTGHGDSGSAARFFYCAKASRSERTVRGKVENKHPTVKPLKLMEYLVKLITMPEDNYVLDPFCGSGSTLVACKRLGVTHVGIDSDPESIKTSRERLRCANAMARGLLDNELPNAMFPRNGGGCM